LLLFRVKKGKKGAKSAKKPRKIGAFGILKMQIYAVLRRFLKRGHIFLEGPEKKSLQAVYGV